MLNTEPLFVEQGVPVFADHADANLYWYLPSRISLAQRNGQPVFSFIKYRNQEGQGGGLLSFQVDLGVPPRLIAKIMDRLEGSKPRLVPVPFVDGSVQCVTLDAGADPERSGDAPRLVNQVLGAAKPSLQGDNSAIFTLSLSRDGAEVAESAMRGGVSLLGVIYQLDYTAMQPALKVKVTARMEQIYRFLGASVTAQYKFLRADLSAAIERMKAEKKLVIERTDTQGTEASGKELDAATKMFTDLLLKDWFTPLLVPGTPRTSMAPNTPYNPNMAYSPNAPFTRDGRPNPFGISGSGNGLSLEDGDANPFNTPVTPGGDPDDTGSTPTSPQDDNPFNKSLLRSQGNPFGGGGEDEDGVDGEGEEENPFNPPAPEPGKETEGGKKPEPGTEPEPEPGTEPGPGGDTPVPPPTPEQAKKAEQQKAVDGTAQGIDMLADKTAGAIAQKLPLPQVTLQLKAIDQKELRDFHAEYSSRTAIQRTYRPQGFFGLTSGMLEKMPPSMFLEVDSDSDFWRRFDVAVHGPAPADFQALGLRSAVARIQYGLEAPVDKSFRFMAAQAEAGEPQMFSASMRRHERDYQPLLTYAFDQSWTGDAAPRVVRPPRSELRELYLVPQRDFRFVVLTASFTTEPDWSVLNQIQLQIDCAMPSTDGGTVERFRKNVVVRPDWVPGFTEAGPNDPLPWRIRFNTTGKRAPEIHYTLTFYYKDGSKRSSKTVRTDNADLVLHPEP